MHWPVPWAWSRADCQEGDSKLSSRIIAKQATRSLHLVQLLGYLEPMLPRSVLAELQGNRAWTAMAETLSWATGCNLLITDSKNSWGWKGPLEVILSNLLPPRASCPRPHPQSFWVSPRLETPPTSLGNQWINESQRDQERILFINTTIIEETAQKLPPTNAVFSLTVTVLVYQTLESTPQENAIFWDYGEGVQ